MQKKGFTLIELLAVILMLGIIALITVPTVSGIIEKSKKNIFNSTALGMIKAVEKQCYLEKADYKKITDYYHIKDKKMLPELEIEGKLPTGGTLYVNKSCKALVALYNEDYCALKLDEKGTLEIKEINSNECDIAINEEKHYESYEPMKCVSLKDDYSIWVTLEHSSSLDSTVKIISYYNLDITDFSYDSEDRMYNFPDNSRNSISYYDINTYLDNFINKLNLGDSIKSYGILSIKDVENLLDCQIHNKDSLYNCLMYSSNNGENWTSQAYSWGEQYDDELTIVFDSKGISTINLSDMECESCIYGLRPVLTVDKDILMECEE